MRIHNGRGRFAHIPQYATHDSGYLYVAEFDNGLVKVGFSSNPRTRIGSLEHQTRRKYRAELARIHIGCDIGYGAARKAEQRVIARLAAIGLPCTGTQEYFQHIQFGTAVNLVKQMARTTPAKATV